MPVTRLRDRASGSWSGATAPTTTNCSAPAAPAYPALTPNAVTFVRARSTPMAAAAMGCSRTASNARPHRPRTRFHPAQNMTVPTATTTR